MRVANFLKWGVILMAVMSGLFILTQPDKYEYNAMLAAFVASLAGLYFIVRWCARKYSRTKKQSAYRPAIAAVVFQVVLTVVFIIINSRLNDRVILHAVSTNPHFAGVYINFKEGGRLEIFTPDNPVPNQEKYWGKYSLKDSVITIRHCEENPIVVGTRLHLESKRAKTGEALTTLIYQTDNANYALPGATIFMVK